MANFEYSPKDLKIYLIIVERKYDIHMNVEEKQIVRQVCFSRGLIILSLYNICSEFYCSRTFIDSFTQANPKIISKCFSNSTKLCDLE